MEMPTVSVSRAAAMAVPVRRGYASSSFSVGAFSLGVDSLFYLFFFEECLQWVVG